MKPTPETDDFAKNLGQIYAKSKDAIAPAAYFVNEAQALIDKLVGKLERERDEANQKARNAHSILYGCDTHRQWSGYSCIGCIESERDLLQHQRNKGLETISALAEERDQLKERVKLLEAEVAQNIAASVTFDLCEAKAEIETLNIRHAAAMLHTHAVVDENTQLRKVADELAEVVMAAQECFEKGHLDSKSLVSYNQLPHAIERNKSR